MQKDETADKQTFLREQIVQQGYSAEDFLQYLLSRKKNGDNIDTWTLAELKAVVKDYKSKQTESAMNLRLSKQKFTVNYEMITDKEIVSIFEEKEKRVEYEKHNLYDIAFKKQVDSVLFKPFLEGSHAPPEVIVEKPEVKVSGGFFFGIGRTSELWYNVRSNVVPDSTIKRSDNDLGWLRDTLTRLYPCTAIPPFHLYSGDLQKEDRRSLQRRARLSGYFLLSVAQNELLFNSKLFIAFLTWTDYNKFTEFKKQIDKIQLKKSINSIPSLTGKIDVEISTKSRCILRAANAFTVAIDPTLEKIHSEVQNVSRDFDKLAESILKMGNHFADLQQQYSNMINYAPEAKFDALSDVFITVNNILHGWGKLVQQNKKIIVDNVGLFFRYNKQENKSLYDYLSKRNEFEEEYLKFKGNLQSRKMKIFQDPALWEVPKQILSKITNIKDLSKEQVFAMILPKETQAESAMREWLGFLNKSCEKEFSRMCQLTAQRHRTVFKKMGQQLCQNAQQQLDQLKKLDLGDRENKGAK